MRYRLITLLTLLLFASIILGCAKESEENGDANGKSEPALVPKNSKVATKSGASDADSNADESGTSTSGSRERNGNGSSSVPLQMRASTLVADDMFGAVVVYPREFLAEPLLAEVNLAQLIDEAMPDAGFSVADVEQVVWLLSNPEKSKRTLVATPRAAPGEREEAAKSEAAEPVEVEPPVNLDDLFEGLEPAKPVPPDEVPDFESDAEPETQAADADDAAEETGFHAFDLYWTPKFLPVILRFAESSKADHFARLLTKDMSEVEWSGTAYFKQERVSGKPPTIASDSSPAIRQYLGLGPMCVYLPDVHTLVLATEPRIRSMISAGDDSQLDLDPAFEEVLDAESATAGVAGVIDFRRLRGAGSHESLLEELSDRCLGSRMMLLNLADNASVLKLRVDVAAEALIQLDFVNPGNPAARDWLFRDLTNLANLVAEVETPQQDPLGSIVDELVQGISMKVSDSKITIRTERPKQFESVPRALAALLEQIVAEAEEALWRHSLGQVAFAMQTYAAERHRLPPAATYDENGKPLLSWRVHLLPYLGHEELYEQFHLDEPWNSAHNIMLLDRMPKVYGKTGADTRVLVFTGRGTFFQQDRETPESVIYSDEAAETILLVRTEDTKPVAWTEPKDLDISSSPVEEVLGDVEGGILAAFCDGSVGYVVPGESQPLDKMIRPGLDR